MGETLDMTSLSTLLLDGEEIERIDYGFSILYKRVHPCGIRITCGGGKSLSVSIETVRDTWIELYADRHYVGVVHQDSSLGGTWQKSVRFEDGAREFALENGVITLHGISLSGGAGDVALIADDAMLKSVGEYSSSSSPLFAPDTLPRVKSVDLSRTRLTAVGGEAFMGYRGELRLPDTIEEIGTRAFADTGHFPKEVVLRGVKRLNNGALEGTGIVSVTAPDVTTAGFSGMTEVERVDIGESPMQVLQTRAFVNCPKLREVVLPAALSRISGTPTYSPFKGCTSLERLTMPRSLTYIGNYALRFCPGLRTLDLYTNSDLSTVVTLAGTRQFEDAPADYSILVPKKLFQQYVADKKWSAFKEHIKTGEETES